MHWDYADLSKLAKESGGPELLLNTIMESGRKKGRAEMVPWLLGTFAVGCVFCSAYNKIISNFRKQRQENQRAVDTARAEIIQGIKAYDAEQDLINKKSKQDVKEE